MRKRRNTQRRFSWERLLVLGFSLAGLSHAVGVFTPEVGFDAVWYHLPIAQVFINRGFDGFIPELYQSAMPHLGSLLFAIPYRLAGVFGVKLFIYTLSWLMVFLVYRIAKPLIGTRYALFGSLIFFTFHTVGWQASSAYVDSLRTVFELAAVLFIMQKPRVSPVVPGLLIGLALSTKLLAFLALPAFIMLAGLRRNWRFAFIMLAVAFAVVLPWLVQSARWTGNPIYPLFQSTLGADQIAHLGYKSWVDWIVHQTITLPFLPLVMSWQWRDWTSPVFMLGAISAMFVSKKIWVRHLDLLLFVLLFMIPWFFFPPISVRYALTGFALATVLGLIVMKNLPRRFQKVSVVLCALGIIFNLTYRFGANMKQFELLAGKVDMQVYLQQHSQGVAKGPIEKWYSEYWAKYGKSK